MERIEIVAKTLDEAIANALKQFNTTREKISVRIVDEGSKGIFGLGAKDAKIVASLKEEPIITEPAAETGSVKTVENEPKVKREYKPTTGDVPAAQKKALEFVNGIIGNMSIDCKAESIVDSEGNVKVILTGDGVGVAIGRRGETLDAIQYLTNLCVNKGKHGDDYVRITLDTENYRSKREETLVRLANSMASKVVKYHKEMSLEPMNPYERRIIHSALQSHRYVKTVSVGEEPNRRILITLKK